MAKASDKKPLFLEVPTDARTRLGYGTDMIGILVGELGIIKGGPEDTWIVVYLPWLNSTSTGLAVQAFKFGWATGLPLAMCFFGIPYPVND